MAYSDIYQIEQTLEWQEVGEGIKRKVYGFNDQLMMVKIRFETGAQGTLHKHFHTQVSYVESGVFELQIGDEKKILRKGDGYYVPPETLHSCICLEGGTLIDVFNPRRLDFV
ncbi:MAG TPA: cupin domain-containing protein [Cytophagales bacterium]|nr:cupin domain-containing protein [Cytophagales bacterium]